MRNLLLKTSFVVAAHLVLLTPTMGQSEFPSANEVDFNSENAVIDTAIPFAIGARQAQQTLRGAFGWDTFQEGLVEGVYFRFDPDGYARFSTSPRLDTDVFEVICRPRTLICTARKDALTILLDTRGRIQLKIDQILKGDTIFVSEGVSELQLPERILQPLDLRLETLLMAGGEMLVRRDGKDIQAISLQGFSAVVPYLRWVAARQDYTVLPRGWPVPNSNAGPEASAMTQPSVWASPMPQPQRLPSGSAVSEAPLASNFASENPKIDRLNSEIEVLRQALLAQNSPDWDNSPPPAVGSLPTVSFETELGSNIRTPDVTEIALERRLSRIETNIEMIWSELENQEPRGIKIGKVAPTLEPAVIPDAVLTETAMPPVPKSQLVELLQQMSQKPEVEASIEATPVTSNLASASQLELSPTDNAISQLSAELGISKSGASMLLTLLESSTQPSLSKEPPASAVDSGDRNALLSDQMVQKILADIENDAKQMPPAQKLFQNPTMQNVAGQNYAVGTQNYVRISEYLNGVLQGTKP